MKRCDGYLFGGMYDKMFGLNRQKIIVYDTPGFGDSDMGKVSMVKVFPYCLDSKLNHGEII